MTVRPARPEEAARLSAIARAAYAPFAALFGPEPPPAQQDFPLDIASGRVWAAGEPPVGFIVLRGSDKGWLIENLGVDPAAQGLGTGRALLGFAEAEGRRRGHRQAVLYTSPSMIDTVQFYRRLGYREAAPMGAGTPRICLTKDL